MIPRALTQARFAAVSLLRWGRRTLRFRPLVCPADESWPLWKYVHWRMWYDRDPRLVAFEDKIAVKDLARRAGLAVVPVLAELDAGSLDPEGDESLREPRFVLKTNHGYDDVVLVERLAGGGCRLGGHSVRRDQASWEEARRLLREHFVARLGRVHARAEWAVGRIAPRRLFAEPWLPLHDDLKVWVVRGKACFITAHVDRWSPRGPVDCAFDAEWRFLGTTYRTLQQHGDLTLQLVRDRFPRPADLEGLRGLAEALVPPDMSFMRADFYSGEDGGFVLGECTTYPAGGYPLYAGDTEHDLGRRILRRWREVSGP